MRFRPVRDMMFASTSTAQSNFVPNGTSADRYHCMLPTFCPYRDDSRGIKTAHQNSRQYQTFNNPRQGAKPQNTCSIFAPLSLCVKTLFGCFIRLSSSVTNPSLVHHLPKHQLKSDHEHPRTRFTQRSSRSQLCTENEGLPRID